MSSGSEDPAKDFFAVIPDLIRNDEATIFLHIFGVITGVLTLLFVLLASPPERAGERFHGGGKRTYMYKMKHLR